MARITKREQQLLDKIEEYKKEMDKDQETVNNEIAELEREGYEIEGIIGILDFRMYRRG